MKLITEEEMEKAYHKTISAWRGLELVAQAQLDADQKVLDVLELAQEGYTEMAVREIFEEIEKDFEDIQGTVWQLNIAKFRWQAFKQSTLKKYGGEK